MDETLGKRIAGNRKRLGITQDRLAEQLGVTAQAVSKWENDQSCPDIATLPKLAEIFGISVDALLGVTSANAAPVLEAEVVTEDSEDGEGNGLHIHNGNWEFSLDTGKTSLVSTAVLFIWVGLVYMLRSMGGQDTDLWSLLWPSALLIYGGFALYSRFSFVRLACAFMGACFLFSNMNDMTLGGSFVLPALLILLGASLLVRALRKPHKPHFTISHNGKPVNNATGSYHVDGDSFDCDCSFCERMQVIDLPVLRRGDADVSFGQLTLDLSGVAEFAPGCKIDADCSFGELTLLIPRHIRAEIDSDTSFGSVDITGNHDPDATDSVTIGADVSFGQINIKYI